MDAILSIIFELLFGEGGVSLAIFRSLFGSPAKAATPQQQASVGYYDEVGPFGSITWEKNKQRGGPGYTRRVELSDDELARLGISDDLRSQLARFAHLFKADTPAYTDFLKNAEGEAIDPRGGGMFQIASNMLPGIGIQNRMNRLAGLQSQLDYQPMYQAAFGGTGMTGVQHPGTPAKAGLLSKLGQIGKLASMFTGNPMAAAGGVIM